jgi:hypothetical protein
LIFTIPAACIFLVRCAFYIPAMVIGKKGIMDSIRWSFNHITWVRALKIVGIGFVVAIILGMVGGIGGGIAGAMGTTGLALNHIISGLMQGVTLAGTAAFYTGLWYRFTYTETEQDTEIEEIGTE